MNLQDLIDRQEQLEPGFEQRGKRRINAWLHKRACSTRVFPVLSDVTLSAEGTSVSGRIAGGPIVNGAALTSAYVARFEKSNWLVSTV